MEVAAVRMVFTGIMVLILSCCVVQGSSFGNAPPVDELTVEVTLGKDQSVHTFKVPIVVDAKQRKIIDDQVAGGEWAWTGACNKGICVHGIWITADAVGKQEVNVWTTLTFQFEGGSRCEVTREFRIVRGESAQKKMKCRKVRAALRFSISS